MNNKFNAALRPPWLYEWHLDDPIIRQKYDEAVRAKVDYEYREAGKPRTAGMFNKYSRLFKELKELVDDFNERTDA